MYKDFLRSLLIIFFIALVMVLMVSDISYAQFSASYPYFGLTSVGPHWIFDGSGTPEWIMTGVCSLANPMEYINPGGRAIAGFFGFPGYGGYPGLASFVGTGAWDFDAFGFGVTGVPCTGTYGGFGSPVSGFNPYRSYPSFGLTSMGPAWSASMLGVPSWIMTGLASPWFITSYN